MRGWRPARFAELEEDAPAQVERRRNVCRYRAHRPPSPAPEYCPSATERALGRAMAAERVAILRRADFLRHLRRARVGGPFALSCAATGFIYSRLGEMPGHIPVADYLTRREIEEHKARLLGESALPAPADPLRLDDLAARVESLMPDRDSQHESDGSDDGWQPTAEDDAQDRSDADRRGALTAAG